MSIVETKRYYVVGIKGEIIGIYDDPVKACCHGKSITQIFEFVPVNMGEIHAVSYQTTMDPRGVDEWDKGNVRHLARNFYSQRDDYGCFGDVIQISRHLLPHSDNYIYTVDSMMWRAYIKPGLAADLVPFVLDAEGKLFFVGIIRGKNPGKGKSALVGGFVDIDGLEMETAAECAIREGKEEIGLEIVPASRNEKLLRVPNVNRLKVRVWLCGMEHSSVLSLVGTYFTSQEENLRSGLKRVYQTTAYTLLIQVDCKLTKKDVGKMFLPGDDAREIAIILSNELPGIEFASGHHRTICDDALDIIKRQISAKAS